MDDFSHQVGGSSEGTANSPDAHDQPAHPASDRPARRGVRLRPASAETGREARSAVGRSRVYRGVVRRRRVPGPPVPHVWAPAGVDPATVAQDASGADAPRVATSPMTARGSGSQRDAAEATWGHVAGVLRGAARGAGRWTRRRLEQMPVAGFGARDISRTEVVPLQVEERPCGVLLGDDDAVAAADWARDAGLPAAEPRSAWAAVGALAALALVDDGHGVGLGARAVPPTIVDRSGAASPLTRWTTFLGYDTLSKPNSALQAGVAALVPGAPVEPFAVPDPPAGTPGVQSVDPVLGRGVSGDVGGDAPTQVESEAGRVVAFGVDLLTRLHPTDCEEAGLAETLVEAAWALAPSGITVFTVPLVATGPRSFGPPELRALLARADALGLTLVGDLDATTLAAVRECHDEAAARRQVGAYGLVRLALRRSA